MILPKEVVVYDTINSAEELSSYVEDTPGSFEEKFVPSDIVQVCTFMPILISHHAMQYDTPFLSSIIYLFFPRPLPFFPPIAAAFAAPPFLPSVVPSAAFCLKYNLTTFSTLPRSCLGSLKYVNLALLALLAARWTTSMPSTNGL